MTTTKTTTKKVFKCTNCKKDLVKVGVGAIQQGEMAYKISAWSDKKVFKHPQDKKETKVDSGLEFEQDDFEETDGALEFFCQDCGALLLLDEDEVIKIMLEYQNEKSL